MSGCDRCDDLQYELDDLEWEREACQSQLDDATDSLEIATAEIKHAKTKLKTYRDEVIVPVLEGLGASNADILLALDSNDPVGRLVALVKR